jgi:AbiTii
VIVTKKPSLVDQIERDALDGNVSLADALRKCVAFGGRAGSAELPDWATRELHGYEGVPEVPGYRKILAPIVLDGRCGASRLHRSPAASRAGARLPATQGSNDMISLGTNRKLFCPSS